MKKLCILLLASVYLCMGASSAPIMLNYGAIGAFTDTFEGTDGNPPSSDYWDSLITINSGNVYSGSYVRIQSNDLQAYVRSSSGFFRYIFPTKLTYTVVAGRKIIATTTGHLDETGYPNNATWRVVMWNANNDEDCRAGSFKNCIFVYWAGKTSTQSTLALGSYSSDGTYTETAGTDWTDTSSATVSLELVDSTHAKAQVNGSDNIGSTEISATLGTNVYFAMQILCKNTGAFVTTSLGQIAIQ